MAVFMLELVDAFDVDDCQLLRKLIDAAGKHFVHVHEADLGLYI